MTREKLVETALGEKGAADGRKYVAWYNAATGSSLPLNCAWCAIFVSWCARQAGVSVRQIPNFTGCTTGRRLFMQMGIWHPRDSWTPRRGDLILFDWDGDPGMAEHVGIVTGADGNYVYTVEGNSANTVREKKYSRRSACILGYAGWVEEKKEAEDMTRAETEALIAQALADYEARVEPVVFHCVADIPLWGRDTVEKLVDAGHLRGDETGDLDLSLDMLRVLVILDREEDDDDDGAGGI